MNTVRFISAWIAIVVLLVLFFPFVCLGVLAALVLGSLRFGFVDVTGAAIDSISRRAVRLHG